MEENFSFCARVRVHVRMYAYVSLFAEAQVAQLFGARARVRRWVRAQARICLCVRTRPKEVKIDQVLIRPRGNSVLTPCFKFGSIPAPFGRLHWVPSELY